VNQQQETVFYVLSEHDVNRLHAMTVALSRATRDLLGSRRKELDQYDFDFDELSLHESVYEISKPINDKTANKRVEHDE